MTAIELAVEEVFAFGDGRTIFAGTLSEPLNSRVLNAAELVIDGAVVATLRISVENPLRPFSRTAHSVSTTDTLPLEPKLVPKGACQLRLHELAAPTPDS